MTSRLVDIVGSKNILNAHLPAVTGRHWVAASLVDAPRNVVRLGLGHLELLHGYDS